ncbi:unnamed protein product [Rotaria sordida]|uniref:Uncharacterized protein n=2 Tax=Rotaria sordida TaxID=392033 RepID=A0A818NDZ3_9BILA|nr:unnamed protein product [Rotaria sordida]CAF3602484.1 unnamed protein product [Rotaria sordida]CAF4092979.1 unnamed protein product [Rotaria sordida]
MVLLDKVKTMYKSLTENDNQRTPITLQNFNIVQNISEQSTVTLSKGWALSLPKTKTRFTDKQKKYLVDAYNDGEETRFKSKPETLSLEIPFVKENDRFKFSPDEYLTASQIKSFFSSITRKRRKKITDSQRFRNQSMTTNDNQEVNSDNSDGDIEDKSNDYDGEVAAQEMTAFQEKAKEILRK